MISIHPPKQLPDESARSWVYRSILEAIVYLDVEPTTLLDTGELQAIFNVSRTPLREAMIQLAKEGFVTLLPQRGSYVAPIDLEEVEKTLFIRVCLEKEILPQACECCTDATFCDLKYVLDCQLNASPESDNRTLHALDERFHLVYYEACRRGNVWTHLRNTNLHYVRFRILNIPMRGMKEFTDIQHRNLYNALFDRDKRKVIEVIEHHLDIDNWTGKTLVEKNPEWFTAASRGFSPVR